jgi:hypothetical protein
MLFGAAFFTIICIRHIQGSFLGTVTKVFLRVPQVGPDGYWYNTLHKYTTKSSLSARLHSYVNIMVPLDEF